MLEAVGQIRPLGILAQGLVELGVAALLQGFRQGSVRVFLHGFLDHGLALLNFAALQACGLAFLLHAVARLADNLLYRGFGGVIQLLLLKRKLAQIVLRRSQQRAHLFLVEGQLVRGTEQRLHLAENALGQIQRLAERLEISLRKRDFRSGVQLHQRLVDADQRLLGMPVTHEIQRLIRQRSRRIKLIEQPRQGRNIVIRQRGLSIELQTCQHLPEGGSVGASGQQVEISERVFRRACLKQLFAQFRQFGLGKAHFFQREGHAVGTDLGIIGTREQRVGSRDLRGLASLPFFLFVQCVLHDIVEVAVRTVINRRESRRVEQGP